MTIRNGSLVSGRTFMNLHLVVCIHGLWGNPANLAELARVVREKYEHPSDHRAHAVHVLVTTSNADSRTYDGVDWGAERVADEVCRHPFSCHASDATVSPGSDAYYRPRGGWQQCHPLLRRRLQPRRPRRPLPPRVSSPSLLADVLNAYPRVTEFSIPAGSSIMSCRITLSQYPHRILVCRGTLGSFLPYSISLAPVFSPERANSSTLPTSGPSPSGPSSRSWRIMVLLLAG